MSIQRQVWFEMLTSGIGLVIGLAVDFPCLPVAEQHTMTGQRSSVHDWSGNDHRKTYLSILCCSNFDNRRAVTREDALSWEWL